MLPPFRIDFKDNRALFKQEGIRSFDPFQKRINMTEPIKDQLKTLAPEIAARFPAVLVLYLFGSQAEGRARPDSDVDVAVFTEGEEDLMLDLRLADFLEQRLGRQVDVVIMQKVSPILQHQVLKQRGVIFERDPGRRIVLEGISFKCYLDALHYQRRRFYEGGSRG